MITKKEGAVTRTAPTKSLSSRSNNSRFGTPTQSDITIISIRPADYDGSIKANVTIQIGSVVIYNFKIIHQPPKRAWLAVPSSKAADGEYYPHITVVDKEFLKELEAIVIAAWRERHWAD